MQFSFQSLLPYKFLGLISKAQPSSAPLLLIMSKPKETPPSIPHGKRHFLLPSPTGQRCLMSKLLYFSPSQKQYKDRHSPVTHALLRRHMIMSQSPAPPLPTLLLGTLSSNPVVFADSMRYLARGEKLRCCLSELDDSNGIISSSRKSKYSTNTQKSCGLSRCFLRPSTVRSWLSWVPTPYSDHITAVQLVWKCFSHKGSDAIFLD